MSIHHELDDSTGHQLDLQNGSDDNCGNKCKNKAENDHKLKQVPELYMTG
jgi:hypothetical protein